ncbi:putative NBD/HSP70 family sugar kinase [Microbacterium sp. ZKA21]|uniref:ROK family protein n=1 Tax=Microbacterium sp. ZKA21 TaxID=3381694 RepID=UPI003D1F7499
MSVPSPAVEYWPGLPDTERRVLLELLLHGEQPRVRIAERLGLSRTSLTRVTRGLIDGGLVLEGALHISGSRGRPAEMLRLRPDAAHFAGVKLTADTMYLVVTDLQARVVAEAEHPLPSREVTDVVDLIARSIPPVDGGEIVAIGIAVAGDVSDTNEGGGVLHHSNFLGWNAVRLADLVTSAAHLPAAIVNDVHALAGAHHWFGTHARHSSLVVYGVGAGIGSGVVLGGDLHLGANGRAGRVGHTRIGGHGRVCRNGHVDCVHSFVTMPAIAHNAGADGYEQVLERARAGDALARAAFEDAGRALGAAIAEAVNAFDPEVIAVMGEGTDMLEIAPRSVRAALAEFLEEGYPDEVLIERPAFDFGLYARGAAVAAMRRLLV